MDITPEISDMNREIYQDLVGSYLTGQLPMEEFKKVLSGMTTLVTNSGNLLEELAGRRAMIIANHPIWPDLAIPFGKLPPAVRGERDPNALFVNPFVKHLLTAQLLDGLDYRSLISPIGFRQAMEDFDCLELPKGGGVEFTAQFLRDHPDTSLFMHPDGWRDKQRYFRTGFVRIAAAANMDTLVLAAFSDNILLEGENRADIVEVLNIPFQTGMMEQDSQLKEWVDHQRVKIFEHKTAQGF